MSRHSRVKYVLPASVLRGRRVVGGKRAGKGFPEEPPLPPPTFPLPCSGAPGAVDVSGRAEPLSPPSFGGKKGGPQRRDALHGPREARVPRVLQPSPLPRGAWGARRGAAMSGPPQPGASVPDTRQPPGGPGARSLRWAAQAMARRARGGPALELLPGQPAPARTRPVSAGLAPRSWLGSALGSRPR